LQDVDDLDSISRLEDHVAHSDSVLIFVTKGYIESANCRRELAACRKFNKPLIVVRETDEMHGAASLADLDQEIAVVPENQLDVVRELRWHWASSIEWYREHYLKEAALSMIEEKLPCFAAPLVLPLKSSPSSLRSVKRCVNRLKSGHVKLASNLPLKYVGADPAHHLLHHSHRVPSVEQAASRESSQGLASESSQGLASENSHTATGTLPSSRRAAVQVQPPAARRAYEVRSGVSEVFVSSLYRSISTAAGRMPAAHADARQSREDEPLLGSSSASQDSNTSTFVSDSVFEQLQQRFDDVGVSVTTDVSRGAPTVIFLALGIFDRQDLLTSLSELLVSSTGLMTPQVMPLYSTAHPFATYIKACPSQLRDLGLFNIMFGKWPNSSELQRVAATHACNSICRLPRLPLRVRLLGRRSLVQSGDEPPSTRRHSAGGRRSLRFSVGLFGRVDDEREQQSMSPMKDGNRQVVDAHASITAV
jgi:hypothetical protein